MTDNDLLTLWCRAVLLDEGQVREVIAMVQDARDGRRADDEEEIERLEARVAELEAEAANRDSPG